ncbi:hypothetical protein, partial [Thomasclavelia ramosa]
FILLEKQISNQYINTRDCNYCRLFGISQKIVRLFRLKNEKKSGEFYVSNKNANIVLWNKRNKSRPNEWMIFYFKLVFFVKLVHIMHGCALETEEVWNGSTRTF